MAERPGNQSFSFDIRVERNNLGDLDDVLYEELHQVIIKTAYDVEAQAKQRAPVDTGFLKSSIQAKQTNDPLTMEVVVGAQYGIYQEFGTVKMAAHPYLIPAVEVVRPGFQSAVEQAIRRAFERGGQQ